MTKLLVLSDSHGLTRRVQTIADRHEVDFKIHCGDSELTHDAKELNDFVTVRGNCDYEASFPEDEVIDVDDLCLFVTHGHLYGIKQSLMQLQYRALEVEADIVLFGHSHVAYCEQIDNQLFINPGSIRQARHYNVRTYCIISWENCSEVSVTFYDIEGNKVTQFPFESSFKL